MLQSPQIAQAVEAEFSKRLAEERVKFGFVGVQQHISSLDHDTSSLDARDPTEPRQPVEDELRQRLDDLEQRMCALPSFWNLHWN